jgi:hypothetical protein
MAFFRLPQMALGGQNLGLDIRLTLQIRSGKPSEATKRRHCSRLLHLDVGKPFAKPIFMHSNYMQNAVSIATN